MTGTTKNERDKVREEFDAAWKRNRFQATRTTLNLKSFDVEMEGVSYVVEMVVSNSSDEDIHDKIGTNECNKFGRSQGNVIKEAEKASTGQEDKGSINNSWNSK